VRSLRGHWRCSIPLGSRLRGNDAGASCRLVVPSPYPIAASSARLQSSMPTFSCGGQGRGAAEQSSHRLAYTPVFACQVGQQGLGSLLLLHSHTPNSQPAASSGLPPTCSLSMVELSSVTSTCAWACPSTMRMLRDTWPSVVRSRRPLTKRALVSSFSTSSATWRDEGVGEGAQALDRRLGEASTYPFELTLHPHAAHACNSFASGLASPARGPAHRAHITHSRHSRHSVQHAQPAPS